MNITLTHKNITVVLQSGCSLNCLRLIFGLCVIVIREQNACVVVVVVVVVFFLFLFVCLFFVLFFCFVFNVFP